eukprot:CAMPEP_0119427926 /NCGR_PEP_ID=MMETSP1335-20130426/39392_1 /TAXON_ID=259385 /ORGANISM="Chrysoculter rhomboideus, Strain RCC1486" /LENGTH=239 /DNA_ID=CAMNT_0007453593 /DNA_START=374 /DNA_END=1091 /DNA_ORIENTATION=+
MEGEKADDAESLRDRAHIVSLHTARVVPQLGAARVGLELHRLAVLLAKLLLLNALAHAQAPPGAVDREADRQVNDEEHNVGACQAISKALRQKGACRRPLGAIQSDSLRDHSDCFKDEEDVCRDVVDGGVLDGGKACERHEEWSTQSDKPNCRQRDIGRRTAYSFGASKCFAPEQPVPVRVSDRRQRHTNCEDIVARRLASSVMMYGHAMPPTYALLARAIAPHMKYVNTPRADAAAGS